MLKSRAGWTLAVAYVVLSLWLLFRAWRCTDDFLCGAIAWPMLTPAGFVYLWLYGDRLASPAVLQWPLVLPTLLTNAALFYLLGGLLARLWQWRSRRRDGR